jgi:Zn-dependent M28 family amino/carboxypeptidase
VQLVNLLARHVSRTGSSAPVFLICSHYDTKVFDSIRFVGANDSGSSTGALIEIARVLGLHAPLAAKTELVFFDGEEAYENFSETDGLYGSRYFAKHLPRSKEQYLGGLLLDMVGDRSLTITLSPDSPPQMTRDIFASAEALKLRDHFTYFQTSIMDDHTPLNAVGISTINLIDFDFPWWHTADDTMDKISAASLQTVGAVTLYYLSEFALK